MSQKHSYLPPALGPPLLSSSATSLVQDHLLLSAIVNASDDAILSKTLDGVITTWNPAAERIFGYTAQEIIGKPKTVLFPADRLFEEEVILDRLHHGITTDHFETVRVRKDGTPLHVAITISPVRDAEGKVIGASTIARDITERKQIEEQWQEGIARLRTSEERYALAVEGSQNGLWNWDMRTGKTHFSARWEQMIGYAAGEFPNNVEAWIAHLHPDDQSRIGETLNAYLHKITPVYEAEFRLRHKDGSYR